MLCLRAQRTYQRKCFRVLCGKFAVFIDRRYDISFRSCMFMQYLRVSAVLVLHICRVWSFICSFSLSRPCEASHKLSERGSTLLCCAIGDF